MKKFLFLIFAGLLFFAAPALGQSLPPGQYLSCDPQAGVIGYDVEVNGEIVAENYGVQTDGSGLQPDGSIMFSLNYYFPGPYTFRLRAIGAGNMRSEWSDPYDATKPESPGNSLKIQEVKE